MAARAPTQRAIFQMTVADPDDDDDEDGPDRQWLQMEDLGHISKSQVKEAIAAYAQLNSTQLNCHRHASPARLPARPAACRPAAHDPAWPMAPDGLSAPAEGRAEGGAEETEAWLARHTALS